MTVSELLELLEGCDPEAEVRIMSQESWPFENAIRGVAVREDFAGEACECDHRSDEPHEEGCPAEDDATPENCAANDFFIVEGEQERYGSKAAWNLGLRCAAERGTGVAPKLSGCRAGPGGRSLSHVVSGRVNFIDRRSPVASAGAMVRDLAVLLQLAVPPTAEGAATHPRPVWLAGAT